MSAAAATSTPAAPADSGRALRVLARDILGGTLAGIAVTFIGHPFDTLKVRLQTQPSNPPIYSGLIDCFKKTVQWEGVSGLYRGVTSPLAGQMLFRANMFLSFGEAKRFLRQGRAENTVAECYLAGSMGWAAGTLMECPIDLSKSQMQVQIIRQKIDPKYVSPYTSTWQCFQTILRTNGVKGIYQGFVPHLMRNVPGGALHLGTFEAVRTWFATRNGVPKSSLGIQHNLVAGGCGGFLFWFVCFPLDCLKSAYQTDSIHRAASASAPNATAAQRGIVATTKRLYQEGGIKRFYRGFSPCLMRSIPANAVMCWVQQQVTDSFPM